MKTTVDLPDALLVEARRVARESGTTLRALLADGLRSELALRDSRPGDRERVEPIFDGELGLQPGVDLGDSERVRGVAYGRWAG